MSPNPHEISGLKGLRVCLVHDWLTGMRGGEKVLEAFCQILPQARIYSLLHIPGSVCGPIEERCAGTSFVQRLPLAKSRYRYYLPLFPRAVESLSLPACDLVLSSSHCVAKGVRPPAGALHVSYLHTPMRYVWDMYEAYFGPERRGLAKRIMPFMRSYLRSWDVASSRRVDHFLANSGHVAERILRHYRRQATVINPPVEVDRFAPAAEVEDYYLVVSALVPYKRVDLAVAACSAAGRRLYVVGTGPERRNLEAMAGPTVRFMGWQPDEALPGLYAKARAFLFCGEEDFGITPVESMAAGRPVIAFGRGGATETLVGLDDPAGRAPTGVFFPEQTTASLLQALERLEAEQDAFDPGQLRERALKFSPAVFKERMRNYLCGVLNL